MEWNDWLSVAAIVIAILALIIRWKMFFNTISKIQEKLRGFPDKKDLAYWILILIIIISFVATWRTDDPGKLADQLSLGGTLLSVLLAVVAIVFSFIQSSDSTRSSSDVINKISEATQNIAVLHELYKEMGASVKTMYDTLNKMAFGIQTMRVNTTDPETLKQAENDIKIFNKVKEKAREVKNSISLESSLFVRNSRHEEMIMSRLVGGTRIKFDELLHYLITTSGANYNQFNFHEMLYDMESRGMLTLEYNIDGHIYIKKAP